ncbi:hypothetical protein Q7A_03715 [Methylophaga nitratireducenticrescens]|nr:hypothetical protein Q7A_03715 [Methylophaga nitratireducenticrescens]AUZ85158.1 hypothetical protein CDW43_11520 [Methylophaga nitratireducenticrescens]
MPKSKLQISKVLDLKSSNSMALKWCPASVDRYSQILNRFYQNLTILFSSLKKHLIINKLHVIVLSFIKPEE